MKWFEKYLGDYIVWILALILCALISVSLLSFNPPSKEPTLYIGHAEIVVGQDSHCYVRPIMAVDYKQADSLFRQLCDSVNVNWKGTITKSKYSVWKIEPKMILKNTQYEK